MRATPPRSCPPDPRYWRHSDPMPRAPRAARRDSKPVVDRSHSPNRAAHVVEHLVDPMRRDIHARHAGGGCASKIVHASNDRYTYAGAVSDARVAWIAFPSALALRSADSAADRSALFASFIATMAWSDFSPPYIAGVGSSPSRRGPLRHKANGPEMRPPRFRCDPFARDVAFDPGRA
jgi:hypothetical protein